MEAYEIPTMLSKAYGFSAMFLETDGFPTMLSRRVPYCVCERIMLAPYYVCEPLVHHMC